MSYIGNGPYQGVLTGGNIQDGTVETTDLADGAVTTVKIADASVTATKLAAGAAVPSQSGQSGKYLTTDGSTASWDAPFEGGVVINESGADVDFRIESDTNANAFFVDGATGKIGIGTSSPAVELHVASSSYPYVRTTATGYTGLDIGQNSDNGDGLVKLRDAANLSFWTSDIEQMRIDSAGRVRFLNQVMFSSYINASTFNNWTGAQGDVFPFNLTLFNVGNHFNTSSSRFTAPISGYYRMDLAISRRTDSQYWAGLKINNSTWACLLEQYNNPGGTWTTSARSEVRWLSAGDYVEVQVGGVSTTGSGMVDAGSSSTPWDTFGIALVA